MITAGAFVAAAAVGAIVRALAQAGAGDRYRLPVGTLAVNVGGSFLLGLLVGWEAPAATVVGLAGIGSLTTFSTFADEVVGLWELDRPAAVAYVAVSVLAGTASAWVGVQLVT